MDGDPDDWSADFRLGPFDGATARLSIRPSDLPRALVVTLVVGDDPDDLLWHSYALDSTRTTLRYLGADTNADIRPPGPGAALTGREHLDAPDDELTRRFYDLLFTRHPELAHLFVNDVPHQAAMLSNALRLVLDHVRDPDWLVSSLTALGAQHAEWGVTPSMYDAFNDCMVTTVGEVTGDAWTAEVEAGWAAVFGEVRDLMLDGAAAADRLRSTEGGARPQPL